MMGVIIDNCYPAYFSLMLESSVSPGKLGQTLLYYLCFQTKFLPQSNDGKGIGYIVGSRYGQCEFPQRSAFVQTSEGGLAHIIKGNLRSRVGAGLVKSIGNHLTGQLLRDGFVFRRIAVDD